MYPGLQLHDPSSLQQSALSVQLLLSILVVPATLQVHSKKRKMQPIHIYYLNIISLAIKDNKVWILHHKVQNLHLQNTGIFL